MKEDSPVNKKFALPFALSLAALAFAFTTSPAAGAHTSRVSIGQERQRAETRSRRRPAKQRKSEQKQEQEVSYTCPMHPDVHEKSPGECPKCGMELDLEKPAGKAKSE